MSRARRLLDRTARRLMATLRRRGLYVGPDLFGGVMVDGRRVPSGLKRAVELYQDELRRALGVGGGGSVKGEDES